jgi:glutamyl-tRNA synthetase
VFNPEKLDWVNQQFLQRMPPEAVAARVEPFLRAEGLWTDTFSSTRRAWFLALIALFKPRIRKLDQFANEARPLLTDDFVHDPAAVEKHLKPEILEPLEELARIFEQLDSFAAPQLEATLRSLAEARGLKPAGLIHATRVAVTGRATSPGLFETLELAGRERVVSRMRSAIVAVSSSG